jgi:hypothetical protein
MLGFSVSVRLAAEDDFAFGIEEPESKLSIWISHSFSSEDKLNSVGLTAGSLVELKIQTPHNARGSSLDRALWDKRVIGQVVAGGGFDPEVSDSHYSFLMGWA